MHLIIPGLIGVVLLISMQYEKAQNKEQKKTDSCNIIFLSREPEQLHSIER